MKRLCSIQSCDIEHRAKGYCNTHYLRKLRDGSLKPMTILHLSDTSRKLTEYEITFDKVYTRLVNGFYIDEDSSCWVWTKSKNNRGYGYLSGFRGRDLAHRVAYNLFIGDIPDGMVIDHLCTNKGCCNPFHLEAVTNRENLLRARRGYC